MTHKSERPKYMPFTKQDLVRMCLVEDNLAPLDLKQFEEACKQVENHFRDEFHVLKQQLKTDYIPLDPDSDTRVVSGITEEANSIRFTEDLAKILERGNYKKITRERLAEAFKSSSLFHIKLDVDMNDFEQVILYSRGGHIQEETVPAWFGLRTKQVSFLNLDRVVLYLQLKDEIEDDSSLGGCPPGSTMLRLFQNVPDADIEMLFPNTRVGMRVIDKLLIGVPAVISGTIVMTTKVGATLILIGSVLGFWLGFHSQPVVLDKGAMIALLAGIGALAAYLWKQFSSFRNRKLKYRETLTRNLYFKLLDNNSGALYKILDDAEESECKESIIAYYFLLMASNPLSSADLDSTIEAWFLERWECRVDFDIEDALGKLERLQLANIVDGHWVVAGGPTLHS